MRWSVGLFDAAGAPITGAAALLTLRVRRVADDRLLDWADGAFKAAGWTTVAASATEVSAAHYPGGYAWTTAEATWADGAYEGLYRYAGAPPQNGLLAARVIGGTDSDTAARVAATLAQADLTYLRTIEGGRWRRVGTQIIFYNTNGVDPLVTFDLLDSGGLPTTEDVVFERRPVAP